MTVTKQEFNALKKIVDKQAKQIAELYQRQDVLIDNDVALKVQIDKSKEKPKEPQYFG